MNDSGIIFIEAIEMKTQIIFESQNKNAVQKVLSKAFEDEIKLAMFLALKEKGLITQAQYEQCIERM